jgi:hypothetical protein
VLQPCKRYTDEKTHVSLLLRCQSKEILPHAYSTSLPWCTGVLCYVMGKEEKTS